MAKQPKNATTKDGTGKTVAKKQVNDNEANTTNTTKNDIVATRKKVFLNALYEAWGIDNVACDKVNIHRDTVWRWKTDDPEFLEAYHKAKERPADSARMVLFRTLGGDDPKLAYDAAKYITTKLAAEYKDKVDITTNGESINSTFILAPVLKQDLPEGAENVVYDGIKQFPDINENE